MCTSQIGHCLTRNHAALMLPLETGKAAKSNHRNMLSGTAVTSLGLAGFSRLPARVSFTLNHLIITALLPSIFQAYKPSAKAVIQRSSPSRILFTDCRPFRRHSPARWPTASNHTIPTSPRVLRKGELVRKQEETRERLPFKL